jgi:cytoskeleton protein RodZ
MEQNDENQNLFDQLKKMRLDKNISLQTISRDSRIQLQYLEAIEAGEFEKIPVVYDKLFFQTYLSYLNLDNADEYLNAFKILRKETFHPTPTTTIQRIKTTDIKGHPYINLKTLFIAGPAVLIIIILGFMAWNSEIVGSSTANKVKELPVRQVVQSIEAKQQAMADSIDMIAKRQKVADKVFVSINAVEKTWIRYIKDGADTTEYLLKQGNKIDVQADSTLYFLVGNAAGVDFTINGDKKGIMGKKGEVISYLKITRKGIEGQRIKDLSAKDTENKSSTVN